jgi:hypothetical protein
MNYVDICRLNDILLFEFTSFHVVSEAFEMINPDDIHPYFQVVVYVMDGEEFQENVFRRELFETLQRNIYGHNYSLLRRLQPLEGMTVYVVSHSFSPSWIVKNENTRRVKNHELDVVILYTNRNYLFIHASCENILNGIKKCLRNDYQKLRYNDFARIMSNKQNLELRSIGIKNVFSRGKGSLDAKAYYGKDTRNSLTTTADSGFGLNYFMGTDNTNQDEEGSELLGGALNKSKIWSGWCENLNDFVERCQQLIEWMHNGNENIGLDVLVTPVEPDDISSPIAMYVDSFDEEKGLLYIGTRNVDLTPCWDCQLVNEGEELFAKIIFGENPENDVLIRVTQNDGKWLFSSDTEIYCSFHNDEDAMRRYNFVNYLNSNKTFTFLFEDGIAYVDGEYFKDNRFSRPYNRSIGDAIDWTNVDIRKESEDAVEGDKNISQAVEEYLTSLNPLIGINDNGANEVADFIAIVQNRFILVHAKYSASRVPGLRVDDLQTVISQAIKNLRFFQASNLSTRIVRWVERQFVDPYNFHQLREYIQTTILNSDVIKECWVVQPGISKSQLEADPTNKIHCLLNHFDSLCRVQGIQFKFICNI